MTTPIAKPTVGQPGWNTAVDATIDAINAAAPVVSIAALRALTTRPARIELLGYYDAGDGGGGTFRWDSSSTTPDNGGTVIAPTAGGTGRWRRVYGGEINARWFGMHPGRTDNTAALQAAVDWARTDLTRSPGSSITGGTVFIPLGYYRFTFTAGTSGLSTITVSSDDVLIRGEGRGSVLTVRSPGTPVEYFFTFQRNERGSGGGIRDLHIEGNSHLRWVIFLATWRNADFEHVSARDIHGGLLDAVSNDTVNMGEDITVRHLDYIPSSLSTGAFVQYGIRFRAGSGSGTTWSECSIRDCLFVSCWDTGVVLDGVQRFTVSQVGAACNSSSSNTIDGSTRAGIFHAVKITNSAANNPAYAADTGFHVIEAIYMESHAGIETTSTNIAVLIETPTGQTGFNRFNHVRDVAISTSPGPGLFRVANDGPLGTTSYNTFTGNRRALTTNQIQVGAGVTDTFLYLTVSRSQLPNVQDQGTRTYINSHAADGSILFPNAVTPPNTSGGAGVIYVEGGALKFRGGAGTVTTIAPA